MRVVCLSDTHGRHATIAVPPGDVLIHAGDLTMQGTRDEIFESFAWLAAQPHERIVFTPGNHDFGFEREPAIAAELASRFPRVEILIDRGTTVADKNVYGSPFQPWFHDWAFNFAPGPAGAAQARAVWDAVPDGTEILITHGPVRGILDTTWSGAEVGCPELAARIARLTRLRLHVCGHIHEAYGTAVRDGVLYVNASSCTLQYRATQPPIVVDVDARGATVVR